MKLSSYLKRLVNLWCLFIGTNLIVPSYISISTGVIELSLDRIVFIILFLFWIVGIANFTVVRKIIRGNLKRNKGVVVLFLSICVLQWLSVFLSIDFAISFKRYLYYFIYIFLGFFFYFTIPIDDATLRKVGNTILISSIIIIGLSFLEFLLGANPFVQFFGVQPSNEFQEWIISNDKMRGGVRRVMASFPHPLVLAQYIVIFIPVLLFLRRFLVNKFRVTIVVVLLGVCAYFPKSRAAFVILALFLLFFFYNFLVNKKIRFDTKVVIGFLAVGILMLTLTSLNYNVLVENFGGHDMLKDENRSNQFIMTIPLLVDHFFTGYGFGMGADVLGYANSKGVVTIDNFFITLALDNGILLTVIFIIFLIAILLKYFGIRGELRYLWLSILLFVVNLFTLSLTSLHPLVFSLIGLFLILRTNKNYNGRNSFS